MYINFEIKSNIKWFSHIPHFYKYLIYAKSQKSYTTLGRIVANQEKKQLDEILQKYEEEFLKAIKSKGSVSKTYNVLLHMFGYFKS